MRPGAQSPKLNSYLHSCPSSSSSSSSSSTSSSSSSSTSLLRSSSSLSLLASSPSSVASRSVLRLCRQSSRRLPHDRFQITLLAMFLLQVCSHACNLPLSQVAAAQGRVMLAGVLIRENAGTFRQIRWKRLRGGGGERPDVERVCVVGSGNWGSTVARIIGQNTERLGDRFDRSVKMWV